MDAADTPNPFEVDYTPSMRQVGTGLQFCAGNAAHAAHSSARNVANEETNFGGGGGAVESVRGDGGQMTVAGSSCSHEFAGLTAEILEQMSNSDIAELVTRAAGVSSTGCVASIEDVDFKGHWGDEAYLISAIGGKVDPMDLTRIMAALSEMHAFVTQNATSGPSPSPPPPQVRLHLRCSQPHPRLFKSRLLSPVLTLSSANS
jgi:hypothetical protein